MRKLVRATLLLMCGILGGALLHAQSVSHHSTNLKVYVEPLNGSNADLDRSIRSRLIDDFVRHGIFVVESEESADAILTGSALTQSTFGTSIGRRPNMRIRGSMRLFNSKGVALWAEDVSSDRYVLSQSSSFVSNVTKRVAKALTEEESRKSSNPAVQEVKRPD